VQSLKIIATGICLYFIPLRTLFLTVTGEYQHLDETPKSVSHNSIKLIIDIRFNVNSSVAKRNNIIIVSNSLMLPYFVVEFALHFNISLLIFIIPLI